jgi:hypothetical protein
MINADYSIVEGGDSLSSLRSIHTLDQIEDTNNAQEFIVHDISR